MTPKRSKTPARRTARLTLGAADGADALELHALITDNLEEGQLLPRAVDDLVAHAGRFVVVRRGRTIVGCAELAPLGPEIAEVRSLAVDRSSRTAGIGTMLVDELRRRARREGFERLCAFTGAPAYFVRMGFSIVPHLWLPEKIATTCAACALFRRCGKYAVIVSLADARQEAAAGIGAAAGATAIAAAAAL